ncbi:MAG TPA: phosphate signaling complex protein PhoU [Candidatus Onthocola gallistercoris]|uniref:Phosphate-specific transport system accessory protein PhoU n=1 Tax=Candidatus Onthocola gallistercoris TaxID=2840876 RepID=A0A9D1KWS1_9FIRM|nr:phosphate signaling complex protein PhoU [Candidatus Onthocola gallistercoris]
MREFYENQLEELHSALITMGNTCQKSIENTSEALILNDKKLASKVMKQSTKISQQERDIEGKCMNLLLLQQPMAGDFRQVSAALKIITDMERIGIQAGDIAEILLTDDVGLEASKIPLQKMADETIQMLKDSMDALVNNNLELARATVRHDDVVDQLFNDILHQLSSVDIPDSQRLNQLMIAKYYERIGDHSVNIANWVIYSIRGKHENID